MDLVLNEDIIKNVAKEKNIKESQIKAVLEMLKDDKTVAFIARYRKEATGNLDEEEIREISDLYEYNVNLNKRKEDVKRLIAEKGLLTEELEAKINACEKLIDVEDLYLPYKEKKKTKATEAINNGLSPLADYMMQLPIDGNKEEIVNEYLNEKVKTYDDAITGAKYIIAERISDEAKYRQFIREYFKANGIIKTKKKNNDNDLEEKFLQYYDSSEAINKIKPHRILAINRAESLEVLNVTLDVDTTKIFEYLVLDICQNKNSLFDLELKDSILDSYKRLIYPSISREIRNDLTAYAEEQAIKVFKINLKNLLLEAPIKGKTVLGVDPAFRTGCKFAVISKESNVLDLGVIFPNELKKDSEVDPKKVKESKDTIVKIIKEYNVEIIAIGNGTASRETESFIAEVIKENNFDIPYVIVSEAGASIYSASQVGIKEFPDLPVEKRSAISIARRIQDPLAELVKIDPKNIGVGQYQHDVTPKKLNESLDNVVIDCVNKVGVNLNTASVSLLKYVSGLSNQTAENIVKYREENNGFKSRDELKKVSKLGPKTYEQCVGFTRIIDAKNPLDRTDIHPESYDKALKILAAINFNPEQIGTNEIKEKIDSLTLEEKENIRLNVDIDKYTFDDILLSLKSPARDIRETYPGPKLRHDVMHFEDIKVGMELDGVVRNVVDFGCFIDCYVKYDGLLHVSNMSLKKINHPADMLQIGDNVHVYVISIDYDKHKMELSLINPNSFKDFKTIKVGDWLDGKVIEVKDYYIRCDFGYRYMATINKHDISIYDINLLNLFKEGQSVKAKVLDIDYNNHTYNLTMLKDSERVDIKNIKKGTEIDGIVKAINEYGIYVDLGVKKDAFVRLSNMSLDKSLKANDIVKKYDKVHLYILNDDESKNTFDASLINPNDKLKLEDIVIGNLYKGVIKKIESYGIFVDIGLDRPTFIHISNLSLYEITDPNKLFKLDDEVNVYILSKDEKDNKTDGSLINPKDRLEIKDLVIGNKIKGFVKKIEQYGIFVDIGLKKRGFIHNSLLDKKYNIDDEIECYINNVSIKDEKIDLSMINPKDILKIEDIKEGDEFDGVVRQITSYGAFISLKNNIDGLVHIKNISNKKIDKVEDVLNVNDKVHVYVLSNDIKNKKLQLSLIDPKTILHFDDINAGEIYDGYVRQITSYGAFIDLSKEVSGLLPINRISKEFISDINDYVKVGETIKVYVLGKDKETKRIELSLLEIE